ncbi:MAG: hypothetical protein ACI36V_01680, partial [Coriobacteriales bacterium]
LERGLYVSAPAVCYLQLCSTLDLVDCIKLGFELCSTYALTENRTLIESPPLTSKEAIARLAAEYPCYGKSNAMRALRYVLERSRSPKETELAMKLGLPAALGGFGLASFEMNPQVALGEFGRQITKKSYCCPDLLWAANKLDVEYNGRDWHSFPEQHESDLRRRQALAAEGYTVLTVDQRSIERPEALRPVADEICRITSGRRLRIRGKHHGAKADELYARFLAHGAHVKEQS